MARGGSFLGWLLGHREAQGENDVPRSHAAAHVPPASEADPIQPVSAEDWVVFSERSYGLEDGSAYVVEHHAYQESTPHLTVALLGKRSHPDLAGANLPELADPEARFILPGPVATLERGPDSAKLIDLLIRCGPRVEAFGAENEECGWVMVGAARAGDEADAAVPRLWLLAGRRDAGDSSFRMRIVAPDDAIEAVSSAVGEGEAWHQAGTMTLHARPPDRFGHHWLGMLAERMPGARPRSYGVEARGPESWPLSPGSAGAEEFLSFSYEDEVARGLWEEVRTRYRLTRTSEAAAIEVAFDTRPAGSPDASWREGKAKVVAQARTGPELPALLRLLDEQFSIARDAVDAVPPSPGWMRLEGDGAGGRLCYRFSGGSVEVALAPDAPASLDGFTPRCSLIFQHGDWLGSVESWAGPLAKHLDASPALPAAGAVRHREG
jgi:hypothetical protein